LGTDYVNRETSYTVNLASEAMRNAVGKKNFQDVRGKRVLKVGQTVQRRTCSPGTYPFRTESRQKVETMTLYEWEVENAL